MKCKMKRNSKKDFGVGSVKKAFLKSETIVPA